MEKFILCESGLPEMPYAFRYEVIIRICVFVNGKQANEPVYWISHAWYDGDGYWREYYPDQPEDLDGKRNREVTYLPSAGMHVELEEEDPGAFDVDVSEGDEVTIGEDVVAWYPLPEIPDLANLKPMEVK